MAYLGWIQRLLACSKKASDGEKKLHCLCSHLCSVPICDLIRYSLRTQSSLPRHFENRAQNHAVPLISFLHFNKGCLSVGVTVRWKRLQIFICSIELQKGGGRRDRKASILLSRQQALAPAQTDTNSTSELREEGWVCVRTHGEKRQRK